MENNQMERILSTWTMGKDQWKIFKTTDHELTREIIGIAGDIANIG